MFNRRLLAILSVLLLLGTVQVFAQVTLTTGSIYGTVTGEDRKPLPGVTVTLESGGVAPKTAQTGAGGAYRFAGLLNGTYNVVFDLSGFTQVRLEGIQITAGKNVELGAVMKQTAEEVIVVSGAPPLVDRKKTQVSSSYDQAYMENVPTGRDPWVILDQTPGIDVDRINVGGNTSGQQSIFTSKGGSFADNGWSYDGVDITDPAALGGTPTYYDFDSFQEIQITTGGQDPAIATGGIVINLVTKRGGNSWSGQGSFYYDNKDLQSDNSSDDLAAERFILPSRVDEVYEYGGDLGGPIVQDRLWVWGAYRKQNIDTITATTLSSGGAVLGASPQHVELEDVNVKGNWAYNSQNEGNFQFLYGKKIFDGRYLLPTTNQSPETTWFQNGPTKMYKAEHSWIPNSNLFVDAKYAYVDGAFNLFEQTGKPPVFRVHQDFFLEQGAPGNYITVRPTHNFTADFNWFKQGTKSDHEFKFGVNIRKADVTTSSAYADDIIFYDYGLTGRTGPSGPLGHGKAKVRYDLLPTYSLPVIGFYAGDTWRMDRLTLNLGFNYSHLTSENKAVDVPANEAAPDLLPSVSFPGNTGPTFNNFSPRVGGTFDLTGKGDALVKASYARFFGGVGPVPLGFINPLGGYSGVYIGYQDLNGDGVVTRDELAENLGYDYEYYDAYHYGYYSVPIFYGFGGFDPANPGAFISDFPNHRFIADNFKSNRTEEFLAGVDFQLGTNATIGVNYSHRKYDRLWNTDIGAQLGFRPGVTQDDFTCTPLTTTVRGETFNYQFCDISSALADQLGDVFFLGNVDGYSRTYDGIELTFNKRMSNRWMFRATGDFKTQKIHFEGGDSFQDPTEIPFINDTWWAEQSTGSGSGGTFTGSRWGVKLSGAYQFPGDFTVGAYAKILDGNVVPLIRGNLASNYALSTWNFVVAPFDSERLDTVVYMDLRLEKGFSMGSYGRLAATVDVFNLFNTNEVLRRERRITQSTFNFAADAVSPRIVRFGARYTF